MHSLSALDDLRKIQAALGDTGRCIYCRSYVSLPGEKCSICGGAVFPSKIIQEPKIPLNGSCYLLHIDEKTGELSRIPIGQCSSWPRK